MSVELAFSVTTPVAIFRLMRRKCCWPEGLPTEQDALYTGFALHAGKSAVHKGLLHFQLFLLTLQASASPSLDKGLLWLKPSGATSPGPKRRGVGAVRKDSQTVSGFGKQHTPIKSCGGKNPVIKKSYPNTASKAPVRSMTSYLIQRCYVEI